MDATWLKRIVGWWADKTPLWHRGNLLDDDVMADVHIVISRDGRPHLYTAKLDNPNEQTIYMVTHALVGAAIDWARLYGVNVAGFLGQPACPHCGKVITGNAPPPPGAVTLGKP